MILNHSRVIGEKFSGELHACTLKYSVPKENLFQLGCERAFLHDVMAAISMVKKQRSRGEIVAPKLIPWELNSIFTQFSFSENQCGFQFL